MIPAAAIDVLGYEPSDGELRAERILAIAVLTVAIGDLKSCNKRIRAAAMDWFRHQSSDLEVWCELLGLDSKMVREQALSGNTPRLVIRQKSMGRKEWHEGTGDS